MKKVLKKTAWSILELIPSIRTAKQERTLLPFNILIANFLFQRILRINASVPFSVHYTSVVQGADRLIIGKRVKLSFGVSNGCNIQAMNGITIGDGTIFASNVSIQSVNHDLVLRDALSAVGPITIGSNCWIGSNVVITAGCNIGNNVTIGAGSIVTKDLPDWCVAAGNPCRVLKLLDHLSIADYRRRHGILLPKMDSNEHEVPSS